MKHILSVLLENAPGALSRVVGLFSARGYNIESLTVAPTEDDTLSRMTIMTTGSDDVIEQITKHLNRLVDVVKVVDLTEGSHVERELMLIKVRAVGKERDEFRDETISRLNLVQAPKGNLYMRQSDDHRKAADVKIDIIRRAIGHDGFALIDDDASVCNAVAKAFPNANVIKVPSQDCSYLAQAMEVV